MSGEFIRTKMAFAAVTGLAGFGVLAGGLVDAYHHLEEKTAETLVDAPGTIVTFQEEEDFRIRQNVAGLAASALFGASFVAGYSAFTDERQRRQMSAEDS